MKPTVFFLAFVSICNANAEPSHVRSATSAYGQGRVAQRQHQFSAAIALFRQAIEIEPTFTDAREALIQANLDAGLRMEAAAAMTQLLEIEPNGIRYRIALGQILQEQHQQERALAQFSAVLQLNPDNAEALLGFASAARTLGMKDRAADALDRGRKRFPDDPRFRSPHDAAAHE